MLRRKAPSVLIALAMPALFAGCGGIIRESSKLLGADGITNRKPSTGIPGGGAANPSEVVLVKASHRTTEGQGPVVVTVVRRNPGDAAVTIDFQSVESTGVDRATPGADYQPTWGTLQWGPNDGSPRVVPIRVLADSTFEGTEVFKLEFFNVKGALATVESVTCFIDDSSTPPNLTSDTSLLSAQRGGAQRLRLRAGIEHVGRNYLVAGALGTSPGFLLGGKQVPLNVDWWFQLSLQHANSANFHRTSGILNVVGEAFAEIRSPPLYSPSVIGLQIHHAYVVYDALGVIHLVSNPVSLTIVP